MINFVFSDLHDVSRPSLSVSGNTYTSRIALGINSPLHAFTLPILSQQAVENALVLRSGLRLKFGPLCYWPG